MKLVLLTSRGHYDEELYNVPDELYEEIKAFDEKWGCWSDCDYDEEETETPVALLKNKMLPYLVSDVLNCLEYC